MPPNPTEDPGRNIERINKAIEQERKKEPTPREPTPVEPHEPRRPPRETIPGNDADSPKRNERPQSQPTPPGPGSQPAPTPPANPTASNWSYEKILGIFEDIFTTTTYPITSDSFPTGGEETRLTLGIGGMDVILDALKTYTSFRTVVNFTNAMAAFCARSPVGGQIPVMVVVTSQGDVSFHKIKSLNDHAGVLGDNLKSAKMLLTCPSLAKFTNKEDLKREVEAWVRSWTPEQRGAVEAFRNRRVTAGSDDVWSPISPNLPPIPVWTGEIWQMKPPN